MPDRGTPPYCLVQLRVVKDGPTPLGLVTPEPEGTPGDQNPVMPEIDEVDELLAWISWSLCARSPI
jgi:hypothetical protein